MAAVWSDVGALRPLARDRAAGHRGATPRSASCRPTTRRPAASERAGRRRGVRRRRCIEREAVTDHDVAAFVDVVQAAIGAPAGSWIHYGLTSSRRRRHGAVLGDARRRRRLLVDAPTELLIARSSRSPATHRDTVMIGRTHGIHAEPTTFGAKVALWALQLDRDRTRLRAAPRVRRGVQASAAPSARTPTSIRPSSASSATRLGLTPVPATQVIARDRHAEYLYACASIGGDVELIAVELRHLQRTEVSEVQEGFKPGQKGSSAMPHKRNPITAETISGLARVVAATCRPDCRTSPCGTSGTSRTARSSASCCPTASLLAHYMLRRLNRLLARAAVVARHACATT